MKSVELCDVVDYRAEGVKSWKFTTIPTHGRLPYKDNEFDSVLAITVLHHASNPVELLKEISRVTKEKLYSMETIVGVTPKSRTVEAVNDQRFELEKKFSSLDKNQQMMHASFHDWFYNDVVQGGIDVPMNFATDIQWQKLFSELGLNIVVRYMIGFDQRTSGEYHVIYVCEKQQIKV